MDAVIKEVMRLFAPAPFGMRTCTETTEVAEGLTIEKGTGVMWSNKSFHYSPDLYDNPEKFDPSRWEANESITLQDEAWLAFGQGPRSCPGIEFEPDIT